jgi:formamidopyrimidine-DNA glycosylase
VETVRRELAPWLAGRLILGAELQEAAPGPRYANLDRAAGQQIARVERRGKFLILPLLRNGERLDDLIIHLGMTGVISASPPARLQHLRIRLDFQPGGTAPVILGSADTDGGTADSLFFTDIRRFGRFLVVNAGDYSSLPTLATMGPEPLGDGFTGEVLEAELSRSATAVKTFLLSQRPVAGVGNIYADEALWRAGIHPCAPARSVRGEAAALLCNSIRDVLSESLAMQGTTLNDYRTVTGEAGGFLDSLDAYGRAEQPCRRCGTPLSRIVLAGRGTHFCGNCQRLPSDDSRDSQGEGAVNVER